MAVAFVKNGGVAGDKSSGVTSLSVTVPAGGHALGNLVVVVFGWQLASGVTLNNVTDSRGNAYTITDPGPATGNQKGGIAASVLTTALLAGDTITVAFSGTPNRIGISCLEFSGASVIEDVASTNAFSATATSPSVGPITPASAVTLIIGGISEHGTTTLTEDSDSAGGDTWHSGPTGGTTGGSATGNIVVRASYKITTSAVAQTFNPTPGTLRNWAAFIASLQPAVVGTPISGTDSGSGLDEISVSSRQLPDTGAGTDPISQFTREVPDSGTATEIAAVAQTVSDSGTDSENSIVTVPVSDTDSGSGSDASILAAVNTISDTGTGAENQIVSLITSDAGTSTEVGSSEVPTTPISGSDTGTSSEAATVTVVITVTDTGTGTENVIFIYTVSVSDTGSAAETASAGAPFSSSDTGTGTDAGSVVARYTQTDTGAGSEASVTSAVITGTDSGTDSETSAIRLTLSDTGTGADVIATFTRPVFETASALEETILSAGNAKSGTDSGSGSDASILTVVFTGSDTGTGLDASAIRLTFSDTGTSSDVISAFTRTLPETGTASDTGILITGVPKSGTDSGTGTEEITLSRFVSDSAQATDSGLFNASYVVTQTGTAIEFGASEVKTQFFFTVNDYGVGVDRYSDQIMPEFQYSTLVSANGGERSALVGAKSVEKSELSNARKPSRMTKAT